ncbi:MAG: alpha/beta hydrolase [Bacilli bacterium]|nr:alpha/beta hydrolase [Bacilli bacterium]
MEIEDIFLNYVDLGKKDEKPIVLLHGWGQNIEMMMPIARNFMNSNRVIVIDLPGFGKSSEPTYDYKLSDYIRIIETFLKEINVTNPILIGHSFGGKLSLLFASNHEVDKLVLLASPFKKEIKELSLKVKVLKKLKEVPILKNLESFAKKHIGSTDYKNASDVMRKILVNHINQDITEDVKEIKCPALLIWGDNDKAVPIKDAYELESLMNDAAVIVYPNCTHYAYLEDLGKTISVINSFIKE